MSKYIVVNTANVKATNERLYSGRLETEAHNGIMGALGNFVDAEIREFIPATAESIRADFPMMIMDPEMIKDATTRKAAMIGNYRIPAKKAFVVMPLTRFDEIEVSEDLIEGTDVAVNDVIAIQVGGGLKKVTKAPAASEAKCYFKVTGVRNSSIVQQPFGHGIVGAAPHKMYMLELVLA